jgi:hypothetical protein
MAMLIVKEKHLLVVENGDLSGPLWATEEVSIGF